MSTKSYKERNGLTYRQYLDLRAKVAFSQGFKCGGCAEPIKLKRGAKELHHIDGKPKNNQLWNLVVLCSLCHFEAEGWQTSEDRGFFKRKKKPTKKQLHNKKKQQLNGFIK